MKRLLITGADGFVGRWLVRAARADGTPVVAAIMPDAVAPAEWHATDRGLPPVEVIAADLRNGDAVQRLADVRPDAVVHLAAVASGAEARKNPDAALAVNARRAGRAASHIADAANTTRARANQDSRASTGSRPRALQHTAR